MKTNYWNNDFFQIFFQFVLFYLAMDKDMFQYMTYPLCQSVFHISILSIQIRLIPIYVLNTLYIHLWSSIHPSIHP